MKIKFLKKIIQSFSPVKYTGNYKSWEEADKLCKGYDADEIFEKVKKSTMEVVNGNACYERDSWLFYEDEFNYPLITYLQKAILESGEKYIHVIDWGGSMGSTFFQNRKIFLCDSYQVEWTVVEQPHFVEFGKNNLQNEILKFEQIEDVIVESKDVVLFSSVLQYIEEWEELLEKILIKEPRKIILERTPVGETERIVVEKIKEPIYDATYTCRLLEEAKVIDIFVQHGYKLVDNWKSSVDGDVYIKDTIYQWKSFVFVK